MVCIKKEVLRVEQLSVGLKNIEHDQLLTNICLHLNENEKIALVGKSGSGKSTLAEAIMKLSDNNLFIKQGKILLLGNDIINKPEAYMRNLRGSEIGIITQNPKNVLDPLCIIQDHFLPTIYAHNAYLSKNEAMDMSLRMLMDVGFSSPKDVFASYPQEFSGGECQRIVVALALLHTPKILIADEPTSSLDEALAQHIRDLIANLCEARKISLLWITHDLEILRHFVDRVYVMHKGQIIEEGDINSIYYSPKHPITSKMIKTLSKIYGTKNGE